jgi:hypothetical protein
MMRRARIQTLLEGLALHNAIHDIRDATQRIQHLIRTGQRGEWHSSHRQVSWDVAELVATYFRHATRDPMVHCAVRLATTVTAPDGEILVYTTKGRSHGMDKRRPQCSKDIPVDKGIARKLRDSEMMGVFQLRNLQDAIDNDVWMPCESDKFPDVRFMIIAPINWHQVSDSNPTSLEKVMGGILYVTSPRDNLRAKHIEPLKAFADTLGTMYPAITGQFAP